MQEPFPLDQSTSQPLMECLVTAVTEGKLDRFNDIIADDGLAQ